MDTEKPKRKRANRDHQQRREQMAMDLLIRRVSPSRIEALLIQQEGISQRQAQRYIKSAQEAITISGNPSAAQERGKILSGLNFVQSQLLSQPTVDIANFVRLAKLEIDLLKIQIGGIGYVETPTEHHTALPSELEAILHGFEIADQAQGA